MIYGRIIIKNESKTYFYVPDLILNHPARGGNFQQNYRRYRKEGFVLLSLSDRYLEASNRSPNRILAVQNRRDGFIVLNSKQRKLIKRLPMARRGKDGTPNYIRRRKRSFQRLWNIRGKKNVHATGVNPSCSTWPHSLQNNLDCSSPVKYVICN